MVSVVLVLLAVAQLGCVVALWAGSGVPSAPRRPLTLLGLGLAYDSAVFGLGATLGAGATLHALSVGRFVGHAVLTPLLLVWAVERVLGLRRRWAWMLALPLLAWGVLRDLVALRLVPREFADTLRYTPAEPHGPPWPVLVVMAVVLVAGIVLWRREKRPLLVIAAVVLVVASAAAFDLPPLGNAGEAVLFAAVVAVERAGVGRGHRAGSDRESQTAAGA
ncbi:hypothetical protein IU501_21785 [Nocardia otitidiscaviarum]|uniref:hypothetical protein n=1 Tax=Nocardia otitidiscaviarum TaxID=1823 RepID=UPI000693B198|nr:hypothetical protein [Nocardia otitidiscaviarum]MBF6135623.1 hypothetical protein [Nocardia otitidiscaviarum]MBF6487441.1 hypothetical protein [Nocardia otitidiscaviarum]